MKYTTGMTIEALIGVQDALEAIEEGLDKSQYELLHKPHYRPLAGHAYDTAKAMVIAHGTSTKAKNQVARELEACL
jgi:hypothetical protein